MIELVDLSREQAAVSGPLGDGDPEDEDGILCVDHTRSLPDEAFELPGDTWINPRDASAGVYFFRHSMRRSIMLDLGIDPGAAVTRGSRLRRTVHDLETLKPYSKVDDSSCIVLYLSIIIGAGTLSLPSAMAKLGWVLGLLVLLGLSAWHYCVAYLVSCHPQLLECNIESYGSMGRTCLSGRLGTAFHVCSIICWWSACSFQLFRLDTNLEAVGRDLGGWLLGGAAKLCCGLPIVFFIWKSRGVELIKVSRLSMRTMLAVGAVAVGGAVCHFLHGLLRAAPVRIVAWRSWTGEGSQDAGLLGAVRDLVIAFGGVGFLPYAIADMLHPQHAHKIVARASARMTAFYAVVGIACYIGWGDDLLHQTPIERMFDMGMPYSIVASVMSFLFYLKALFAYPLCFWPLLREIELAFPWRELPCLELRLPWAVLWQRRLNIAVRVGLAILTLAPLSLKRSPVACRLCLDLVICIVSVVQILAPAGFIMNGIWVHWKRLQAAEDRPDHRRPSSRRRTTALVRRQSRIPQAAIAYLGGSAWTHFVASGAVAAISACITLVFLWVHVEDLSSVLQAAATAGAEAAEVALAANATAATGQRLAV